MKTMIRMQDELAQGKGYQVKFMKRISNQFCSFNNSELINFGSFVKLKLT